MALRYLLDTNAVSEWVKPTPDATVLKSLQRHHDARAIAAPTLQELAYGFARLAPGKRRDQLELWLNELAQRLPVLPFDAQAAWWLGVERARLGRVGIQLPHVDGEIAAVAQTAQLVLVARNVKDFERIEGLVVECWHATA